MELDTESRTAVVKISFTTHTDVRGVVSDCLLLKNVSEGLYGPEEAVDRVSQGRLSETSVRLLTHPGATQALLKVAGISSKSVVLVGVGSGSSMRYEHVGAVCEKGTEAALRLNLHVETIATVTHAVGFGLDRLEVFRAELFGFKNALERARGSIQEITFVTGKEYVPSFTQILRDLAAGENGPVRIRDDEFFLNVGAASQAQSRFELRVREGRYVFVAMPFKLEFENVFDFGMRLPIEECGLLPVRLDKQAFNGSIIREMKTRIKDSVLLIADVSDKNPNVLYELGYADGIGIPTVVVCQTGVELPFDLRDIHTVFYQPEVLRNLNTQLLARIRAIPEI